MVKAREVNAHLLLVAVQQELGDLKVNSCMTEQQPVMSCMYEQQPVQPGSKGEPITIACGCGVGTCAGAAGAAEGCAARSHGDSRATAAQIVGPAAVASCSLFHLPAALSLS